MKKAEITFSAMLVPVDYLMIILAALSAYTLRFSEFYQSRIREIVFEMPFSGYFPVALGVGIVWLVIFGLMGLYTMGGRKRFIDEISKVIVGCSAGLAVITILIFFKRELFDSRFIVLAAWALAIIYVSFGRFIVRKIQQHFVKRGYGINRLVVIGQGKNAIAIISEIEKQPSLGYRVVRVYEELNESVRDKIRNTGGEIDELILVDSEVPHEESMKLLDICNENHIIYKYAADVFNARSANIEITMMDSTPLVEIKRTPLDGWGRVAKRIFDIFGSLILIVLSSPVMILTAIAIKLDSKGPVFYLNERIGEKGRKFETIKFRSMKVESCVGSRYSDVEKALALEQELIEEKNTRSGPLYKIKDDPRVTRVGRFIRKTSIDELPQFFNVFRGNMSLVGPRPHQPREVDLYQRRHKNLLGIKPGVSGLAAISGRSDLDFEDEARLDIYYVENWSLGLDLQILLKTPMAVLKKRKAE